MGDSFYEYLLKHWVQEGGRNSNNPQGREAYDAAFEVCRQHSRRI